MYNYISNINEIDNNVINIKLKKSDLDAIILNFNITPSSVSESQDSNASLI